VEFWLNRGYKLNGTSQRGVWIISNPKGDGHAVGIDNEWTGQIELSSAEWHRTAEGAQQEVMELSVVNV
jgi:hypothetical protein